MALKVRRPNALLVISLSRLLNPSTRPAEIVPQARNQLRMRGLWRRRVRAIFFTGSMRDRIARKVQSLMKVSAPSTVVSSHSCCRSSEEVGPDGAQVIAKEGRELDALAVGEILGPLEQAPSAVFEHRFEAVLRHLSRFAARTSSMALFILATM